jgi:hypothetical protein
MITGKAKEDFEKWFLLLSENGRGFMKVGVPVGKSITKSFYKLPFSMQYGVYVDWFDSVGIRVFDTYWLKDYYGEVVSDLIDGGWCRASIDVLTRHKARQKAIEKACEIYNEKHLVAT